MEVEINIEMIVWRKNFWVFGDIVELLKIVNFGVVLFGFFVVWDKLIFFRVKLVELEFFMIVKYILIYSKFIVSLVDEFLWK